MRSPSATCGRPVRLSELEGRRVGVWGLGREGRAIARVVAQFGPKAERRDDLDGISLEFANWRFNLRRSNTEPVVRLNVESRGDAALVAAKQAEIEALLKG